MHNYNTEKNKIENSFHQTLNFPGTSAHSSFIIKNVVYRGDSILLKGSDMLIT